MLKTDQCQESYGHQKSVYQYVVNTDQKIRSANVHFSTQFFLNKFPLDSVFFLSKGTEFMTRFSTTAVVRHCGKYFAPVSVVVRC